MKYKAIIFDLDGVICFTDKYHYLAWKALADRENIYFDEVINNRLRGVSRMASLDIILEKASKEYSLEEKNEMANYKNEIYKKYLLKMSPSDLSIETYNTLIELKNKGLKIAIGSSSKNTKLILTQLGIIDLFDAISDGTNITNSKPDPEVFLKAASFINENPSDCLVVEDAYAGIDAGYNGGFDTCGIGDASNYEKATYKIGAFSEIIDIIK